jgi:hypothetical protein
MGYPVAGTVTLGLLEPGVNAGAIAVDLAIVHLEIHPGDFGVARLPRSMTVRSSIVQHPFTLRELSSIQRMSGTTTRNEVTV